MSRSRSKSRSKSKFGGLRVYCSILVTVVSYLMRSGVLDSSGVLLSYSIILLA